MYKEKCKTTITLEKKYHLDTTHKRSLIDIQQISRNSNVECIRYNMYKIYNVYYVI